MKQSQQLTEFYRDYKTWLDNGAPEKTCCFNRFSGLCFALLEWCSANERRVETFALRQEFKQQLRDVFTDSEYPFGGEEVYDYETDKDTAHLNPERIAWVEAHANLPSVCFDCSTRDSCGNERQCWKEAFKP